MIIRAYAGRPAIEAPDIGEVVYARRSPLHKWLRAVVIHARRNSMNNLKVRVQWLEGDPDAVKLKTPEKKEPIKPGDHGWIMVRHGTPPILARINEGAPSPQD